ncbi:hypothetical protein [Streptomyces griseorubiginosus]|uniref:hypothetical protein n=1 Tax=Streptomyces griseorubiginosus TaxID=67304 RepID=UPI00367C9897
MSGHNDGQYGGGAERAPVLCVSGTRPDGRRGTIDTDRLGPLQATTVEDQDARSSELGPDEVALYDTTRPGPAPFALRSASACRNC